MAKEKRAECSSLEVYPTDWEARDDGLSDLMNLQYTIQTEVYGFDFEKMREKVGSVVKFYQDMNLAIDDERLEQYEALGGVHTYGKAAWKHWKKNHEKATQRPLSELTDEELLELKFELVDELHFFFNKCLALGMTAEELYTMYLAKNKENIERQLRGY